MKVLDLLKKAGIIAVEGEDATRGEPSAARGPADRAARDPGIASDPKKGAAGVKGSSPESRATITMPTPPAPRRWRRWPHGSAPVDFAQIYAALKIPTPAHGWNVDKVQAAIASPHFQTLDASTKQAALLAMLGASNAEPSDIVEDAVRRDQALDAYETFARKKLADRVTGVRQAIAEEEERIRLATQAIERHKQSLGEDEQGFALWLKKKVEQEEALVRVVSLLTDQPVISVGGVEASKPERTAAPEREGPDRQGPARQEREPEEKRKKS